MPSILIIEDNVSQREALVEFLEMYTKSDSFDIYAAADTETAFAILTDRSIDLIVSDLMLPDGTGIDVTKKIKLSNPSMPILILTGQPSIDTAIEAIKAGAADYLQKPVDLTHLKIKIDQLLETSKLKKENKQLRKRISDAFQIKNLVGSSPALEKTIEKVKQIAPTDVSVLIEGESGTGKELIANLIHENSERKGNPFIKVNCGALTKTILESELFGAVRGAYTGSDRDRMGYFESASGGTIFLDEIGEMDLESQVRLLRAIEEKEIVRIGSTKPVKVDVRIVAATNRNLLKEVEEGRFREDLYYRIAVIRLNLPALRERREDIPLLFNHFVIQFNDRFGKSVREIDPDLLKFFQSYDWPGNIRQFRNVLEGMVVLAKDDVLTKKDLPEELLEGHASSTPKRAGEMIVPGIRLEDYEKIIIKKNLLFHAGNREKTAETLGISLRTLYRKLKEFDIQ